MTRTLLTLAAFWGLVLTGTLLGVTALAPAAAQSLPTSGLTLWYKADAVTGQADNTLLTLWPDSSPSGNDLTATTTYAPTYRAGTPGLFGGLPYVYFPSWDGTPNSNKYMFSTNNIPSSLAGDLAVTVFTVADAGNPDTAYNGMYGWGNATVSLGAFGPLRDARAAGSYSFEFAGNNAAKFGSVASGVQITEIRKSPGAINATTQFWVNGTSQTMGSGSSTNTPSVNPSSKFSLGTWANYVSDPSVYRSWGGTIAETIVYDRVLTQAEADQVGSYLTKKYGIASSTYPVYADPAALPLSIPGLALWLDADPGFVGKDGSNRVSIWRDALGTTNNTVAQNVAQTDPARQPLWVADGINGRPAIRFDGSNDYLNNTVDNLLATDSARTVIVVGDADDSSTGNALVVFRRSNQVYADQFGLYSGNVYVYSDGVNGNNNAYASGTGALTTIRQPFISVFRSTGLGSKIAVDLNGSALTLTQPGGVGAETGTTGFVIGARENLANSTWPGMIAEILVYDRSLTAGELNAIGFYLTHKYSIQTVYTPEPATGLLLACGALLVLGAARWRRR